MTAGLKNSGNASGFAVIKAGKPGRSEISAVEYMRMYRLDSDFFLCAFSFLGHSEVGIDTEK